MVHRQVGGFSCGLSVIVVHVGIAHLEDKVKHTGEAHVQRIGNEDMNKQGGSGRWDLECLWGG